MIEVKYPEIEVELSDRDGNAFFIISRVRRAMHRAKVPPEQIAQFTTECEAGDYEHLLETCSRWVEVI